METLNSQGIHCSHTQDYDPHRYTILCRKCKIETCVPCHTHLIESGDIQVIPLMLSSGPDIWTWWTNNKFYCIECQKPDPEPTTIMNMVITWFNNTIIAWFNKKVNEKKGYKLISQHL